MSAYVSYIPPNIKTHSIMHQLTISDTQSQTCRDIELHSSGYGSGPLNIS